MKMNKKVIVSALSIAMGAGIVGSISGTVAWYQYSTRATVQMMGASIGVDRNLQVAIGNDAPAIDSSMWKTELKTQDILNYLDRTSLQFKPVTLSGAVSKNAGLGSMKFKGNPRRVYKAEDAVTAKWLDAASQDYVVIPLWFRSVEKDGTNTKLVAKELGMSDLSITNQSAEGKKDITNAVRIAIEAPSANAVVANNTQETATYGKLDLDGNGENDREWTGYSELSGYEQGDEIVYGTDGQNQTTYSLADDTDKAAIVCEELTDPSDSSKLAIKGGLNLGPTSASAAIKVKLSIWLEGWEKLPTYNTPDDPDTTEVDESEVSDGDNAMWNVNNYVGSKFHIGMTFASGDSRVTE